VSIIDLSRLELVYEPFPIGVSRGVFEPDVYDQLVAAFPGPDLFAHRRDQGLKLTLSDLFVNPDEFHRFVDSSDLWGAVYQELRSPMFRRSVLELLREHGIDLSLLPRQPEAEVPLRGTMEFATMPAAGGHIVPHTDTAAKVVTLVFSMVQPDTWHADWGGGTDMLRATDPRKSFNYANTYLRFDETEVLRTFPYEPNQAVVFIKTFNSLHGVRPMTGPDDRIRRTLTVNLRRLS
jgi:hypothetical protein